MPEAQLRAVGHQHAGVHRGGHEVLRGVGAGERRRGGDHLRQGVGVSSRRDERRLSHVVGKGVDAAGEGPLQPRRQRDAGELCAGVARRPGPGELDERQRVPVRELDDPPPRGRGQLAAVTVDHRRRVPLAECGNHELGDAAVRQRRVEAVAQGEDGRHRLVADTTGDEGQRHGGGRVEPLHVVGDQHDRHRGGVLGDQLERGVAHEVGLDRGLGHPERRQQRLPLASRERLGPPEDGCEETVQSRERDLCLRLDAGDPQDGQAGVLRPARGGLQQRGLPDPGLPADDQCRPGPRQPRDEPVQPGDLILAADEHGGGHG
ncbi:hypothetical protein [Nocardioides sp. TF02-7]|uniref:hypothetical protein n=1 Tax=Nocardioides sp. TF02-7 TaxID=2917724 RepID=UPI001F06A1D9|nr:hypothetical protein [Nocardioides sp. TF02-7]UMG91581.1 hypothetical protein MF408_15935 [Nocardioides sp. TF02-7]